MYLAIFCSFLWQDMIVSYMYFFVLAFCDKAFSISSGTITSPDYDSRSSYANNQNCQFDIRVSSGYVVKLTWSTFDVKGDMPNCYDDYVEIYIGCSRKSIGKYCSDNSYKPHDIYSPDNCLRIKFKSDSSGSGRGFLASYSRILKFSLGMYMYLLHNYVLRAKQSLELTF